MYNCPIVHSAMHYLVLPFALKLNEMCEVFSREKKLKNPAEKNIWSWTALLIITSEDASVLRQWGMKKPTRVICACVFIEFNKGCKESRDNFYKKKIPS